MSKNTEYLSTFIKEHAPNKLKDQVLSILVAEKLLPLELFTSGHSGALVIKVQDETGLTRVLKIATDANSHREITGNIEGFTSLRKEGLVDLLPDPITVGMQENTLYTVMAFLGEDFAKSTQNSSNPEALYQKLIDILSNTYSASLHSDNQSGASVDRLLSLLRLNYVNYLLPGGLVTPHHIEQITTIDSSSLTSTDSCFGVFDFTPEDVFINGDTLKYPDPKKEVRGNPIIDLACFAGVSRDVYSLAGSERGYDLLYNFATKNVSDILNLSVNQAEALFNLGRALQSSLSSRFRIDTEPEKARVYALESVKYLETV